MIQEGDHIAVGISGGKDSLTLLYALQGLRRFYPRRFELSAVTVDLGYKKCDFTPVAELCRELDVPYEIVKTDIAHILFEDRKEPNPFLRTGKSPIPALSAPKCEKAPLIRP